AGKTTLLDAICLGLYGRTPRLQSISGENEIMSRRAGDCLAEVTFATTAGVFRTMWSQRRSRNKPDGNLQPPRHELVNHQTGAVITTKLRDTQEEVRTIVGLDYDHFTRSILLAQGEFSRFLQAGERDRSEILERITGTEIYSTIGRRIFEEFGSQRRLLDELRTQIDAINLLSDDDVIAMKAEAVSLIQELERSRLQLQSIVQGLDWHRQVEECHLAMREATRLLAEAHEAVEAFRPRQEQLKRARLAAPLSQALGVVTALRKDLAEAEHRMAAAKQAQDLSQATVSRLNVSVQSATQALAVAESALTEGRPIWKVVRQLDERISTACELQKLIRHRLQETMTEMKAAEEGIQSVEAEIQACRTNQQNAAQWLLHHAGDEQIAEHLPRIRSQMERVREYAKELAVRDQDVEQLQVILKQRVEQAQLTRKAENAARHLFQKLNAELDVLKQQAFELTGGQTVDQLYGELRQLQSQREDQLQRIRLWQECFGHRNRITSEETEYQAILRQLEDAGVEHDRLAEEHSKLCQLSEDLTELVAARQLRAELAEHRRQLLPGQPCPLCGALEHPFAGEVTESEISDVRQRLTESRRKQSECERTLKGCAERRTKLETRAEESLRRIRQQNQQLCNALLLINDGEKPPIRPDDITEETIQHLQNQSDELCQYIETSEDRVRRVRDLEHQEELLSRQRNAAEKELISKQAEVALVDKEVETASARLDEHQRHSEKLRMDDEAALVNLQSMLEPFLSSNSESSGRPDISVIQEHIEQLVGRSRKWSETSSTCNQLNQTLRTLEVTVRERTEEYQRIARRMETDRFAAEEQTATVDQQVRERKERFGERDADHEESMAATAVDLRRSELSAQQQQLQEARQTSTQHEADWKAARERFGELQKREQTASSELRRELLVSVFRDEAELQAAVLPPDDVNRLQNEQASLVEQMQTAQVRREQNHQREKALQEHPVTSESAESLRARRAALEDQIEKLLRRQGELTSRLQDNDERRKHAGEQQRRLDERTAAFEPLAMLNQLIGCGTGTRYRRFAQGMSFDTLLAGANAELQKLTDRYQLKRSREDNLELSVLDHYYGSIERTVKNLSGGESFLVSLALALGLSKLASRNVRIDSLFLDEGFGSLDNDTLDVALHALSGLHQEGKLVGLISHVSGLKDQIPIQLRVQRGASGCSRLVGPGVQEIHQSSPV
ncbi:MAG: AAA family ATPase, partial [Planctomycetaceae bacterium]|nr:AAA family ATPase [Planctomycetaceae bacterium]